MIIFSQFWTFIVSGYYVGLSNYSFTEYCTSLHNKLSIDISIYYALNLENIHQVCIMHPSVKILRISKFAVQKLNTVDVTFLRISMISFIYPLHYTLYLVQFHRNTLRVKVRGVSYLFENCWTIPFFFISWIQVTQPCIQMFNKVHIFCLLMCRLLFYN